MIRIIVAAPFLAVMVLFALSNPTPVKLGIWPTDYMIEVPISLAILAGTGVGFFLGALLLWVSAVASKARARRAERQVRNLRGEVTELNQRLIRQPVTVPALSAPSSSASASYTSRSLAPIP
jgi:uncharacterized integral membrane protein